MQTRTAATCSRTDQPPEFTPPLVVHPPSLSDKAPGAYSEEGWLERPVPKTGGRCTCAAASNADDGDGFWLLAMVGDHHDRPRWEGCGSGSESAVESLLQQKQNTHKLIEVEEWAVGLRPGRREARGARSSRSSSSSSSPTSLLAPGVPSLFPLPSSTYARARAHSPSLSPCACASLSLSPPPSPASPSLLLLPFPFPFPFPLYFLVFKLQLQLQA